MIKQLIGVLVMCCAITSMHAAAGSSVDAIIKDIQQLESAKDPKCYATASRLEDFMFGTPLSDPARFTQHERQQAWAKTIWSQASLLAQSQNAKTITSAHIDKVSDGFYEALQDKQSGHWQLFFDELGVLKLHKDDVRQYGSIAYSLRALLAVQQAQLINGDAKPLLPLSEDAVKKVKLRIDLLSLAILKVADQQARLDSQHQLQISPLLHVWNTLAPEEQSSTTKPSVGQQQVHEPEKLATQGTTNIPKKTGLLSRIVKEKVNSYAAYNQISNQLFVRNLQVFFAKSRWPADPEQGKLFKGHFQDALIAFAGQLFIGAQALAQRSGHAFIKEQDVHQYAASFIPHSINEFEDATFFPNLPVEQQVTIESYDMDAFRDSGVHWRYLQFAVEQSNFDLQLEPDPFAAELLAENIAQFGVLLLRVTGQISKQQDQKRLAPADLAMAMQRIQQRIDLNHQSQANTHQQKLVSSHELSSPQTSQYFQDITSRLGVDYQHRSSDWLNRLLRSYLSDGQGKGNITIPPAFGGGGIAAEDINNDGWTDLLIVSGSGNRLYLNQQGKGFEDATRLAGLNWRRPDGNPGEPRQPLIADINNDGLQDVIITYVDDLHRVYKNLGNGRFSDVTVAADLGGKGLVGGPATLIDIDQDGLLDLYVTYFGNYIRGVLPTLERRNNNGLPNRLFRNTGNFKFVDVTQGSGLDNTGWAQAVTHTDFNGDGLQDLIVGNDFGVNGYYQNQGKGKFIDVSTQLGTDKPSYSMNISVADLNDDLLPDIYISNIVTMNKDEKYVLPRADTQQKFNADKLAKMRVVEANDLFLSAVGANKQVTYHNSELIGRGYSSTGWSWDADFFDFDNDGDSDLYVLNGMNEFNLYSSENTYYSDPNGNAVRNAYMPVSMQEKNVFFVNQGGKLNNATEQSGVGLVGNSRSASYLDFDNDGDLDIALNNYHEPMVIYQNDIHSSGKHWLKVKLTGDPAQGVNRDAIGAQLVVTHPSGMRIWREVHSSQGYMSVHPKEQHFGLGAHEMVALEIVWPNGQRQRIKQVKSNQRILVRQGQAVYQTNTTKVGHQILPNAKDYHSLTGN